MIGSVNANALTASGMAAFAAAELRFHGFYNNDAGIQQAAAECVAPLLRAAAIAIELSGLCSQEQGAGVHDVILDYISVPPRVPDQVTRCAS